MAVSAAQAIEDMLSALPEGMDVLSDLASLIGKLNGAKAQAALEGDITGAQGFAEAQLMMQQAALGDFAQSSQDKASSAVDVLSGTIIVKPDAYVSGQITYIGIKSLFDQIGGQAPL
ncbi:hypothetical protein ADUPG1_003962 [Aduncisulcus paluster]|uniref:Uncharacterized protein n=1 Tax=Aduncisulcus paluster TaxID=2918883 RepID=A0ABQ5JQK3_9EUKA|nr:hypothetical protein ADUPG1_003962 [Aduncisulcus paluster]